MPYFGVYTFKGIGKKRLKTLLCQIDTKVSKTSQKEAMKSRYAWGYPGGQTGTLICVIPNIWDSVKGEVYLSPVTTNILSSLFAFLIKRILYKLDRNVLKLN